jgi:acyl-CoA thioesterase
MTDAPPSPPSRPPPQSDQTPDAMSIAEASASAMWEHDRASSGLGMKLERVEPGSAAMSMIVTEAMTNGHGMCHGGFIFLLADSTFAFACNSHGQRAVAQSAQISFLAPARLGTTLVAEARERYRADRSGLTDVTVRTAAGDVIAEFRGMSRTIPGKLVPASE